MSYLDESKTVKEFVREFIKRRIAMRAAGGRPDADVRYIIYFAKQYFFISGFDFCSYCRRCSIRFQLWIQLEFWKWSGQEKEEGNDKNSISVH